MTFKYSGRVFLKCTITVRGYGVVREYEVIYYQVTPIFFTNHKRSKTLKPACTIPCVELNPPTRIAIRFSFQKYPIFSIIVRLLTTKINDYEKKIGFYHCRAGYRTCS